MKHSAVDCIAIIRAEVRSFRARRLLNSVSEDDLVQDVLLLLLQDDGALLDKYDPQRGALSAFVRKITRNHLLDLMRKENRRRLTGMRPEIDTDACERATDGRNMESVLLDRLCADCILKCLDDEMTGREREVFLLFFLNDKSYEDIAKELKTTISAVTSRIRAVRLRAEKCRRRCMSDPSSP